MALPPDPMVWSVGALPKRRKVGSCCSVIWPCLPGPPALWESGMDQMCLHATIGADDIAHWPYTTGLLVKWIAFLRYSALACWWFRSWAWWRLLC